MTGERLGPSPAPLFHPLNLPCYGITAKALPMSFSAHLDRHQSRYIAELMEFIAIPSVSADPAHKPDMQRAAAYLAAHPEILHPSHSQHGGILAAALSSIGAQLGADQVHDVHRSGRQIELGQDGLLDEVGLPEGGPDRAPDGGEVGPRQLVKHMP